MLFILVHEIAYHPNNPVSNKNAPEPATVISSPSLTDGILSLMGVNEDILRERIKNNEPYLKLELINSMLEIIDFVKPLQELGFEINYNKEKPWECRKDIQAALLELLDGFCKRYPEVLTGKDIDLNESSQIPPRQAPQTTVQPSLSHSSFFSQNTGDDKSDKQQISSAFKQ